ncbi:hypothetical protein OH76DRAFT_150904 [Lentinus brumalis]|uniref:Uncharacterized protein n=1 Tax=Lentinus brumalis TaxID=2498619 RepID=A0A371CNV6_9APHY|nr:hypothetical protein OH76DRAFT_150904 [Polyporus brumalis]
MIYRRPSQDLPIGVLLAMCMTTASPRRPDWREEDVSVDGADGNSRPRAENGHPLVNTLRCASGDRCVRAYLSSDTGNVFPAVRPQEWIGTRFTEDVVLRNGSTADKLVECVGCAMAANSAGRVRASRRISMEPEGGLLASARGRLASVSQRAAC